MPLMFLPQLAYSEDKTTAQLELRFLNLWTIRETERMGSVWSSK